MTGGPPYPTIAPIVACFSQRQGLAVSAMIAISYVGARFFFLHAGGRP